MVTPLCDAEYLRNSTGRDIVEIECRAQGSFPMTLSELGPHSIILATCKPGRKPGRSLE